MRIILIAVALATVGTLPAACAPQTWPDRWVFVTRNLTRDSHVEDIRQIAKTAAEHGLNAMLLSGGLDGLGRWDQARLQRLEQVKSICRDAGIEIIPLGFSVGYGGSVLGHDRNLAAGLSVTNALFEVRGNQAHLVPDPAVSIPNGNFEAFEGDRFTGMGLQERPGEVSFVDHTVTHGGDSAIRFESFGGNGHGHARAMFNVRLRPHAHYRYSLWVKTDDLQPASAFRLQVYTTQRAMTSLSPSTAPSQDWTQVAFTFNSGDNSELKLYAGLWGGHSGKFWLDDMQIEEVGLRGVLRRPGTPVTVTGEDGKTTYVEGRDYAPIADPRLGDFRGNHEDPPIEVLPQGRIRDGDRLRVSFYHAGVLGSGQVSVCMSEPAIYDYWREQVRLLHENLAPQKYFLSMDEIRAGGSCAACKARNMTMAQILGDCITRQCEIIREVNPQATIYIWSDMLDPNHNAHGDYYLVEGDFTGSWNYIPKDLVIACWYHAKRVESLKFFSDLGYPTLAGAYYDGDDLDNPRDWLQELSKTPGARGIMYTTWRSKYALLGAFGDLVSNAAGQAP